jgi:hypothetical protein
MKKKNLRRKSVLRNNKCPILVSKIFWIWAVSILAVGFVMIGGRGTVSANWVRLLGNRSQTETYLSRSTFTGSSTPTVVCNPEIPCPISENCGGGTTPLKLNECDNTICCLIGGRWKLYVNTKDQCLKDQAAE